ncbi:MAG TPA: AmmeMemoRadiSam system protein A [Candidatus Acidoferrales bacterium]|nr:AmmeMemoRadiSam system protein A [Candidatus Acidoferrales bacterium]
MCRLDSGERRFLLDVARRTITHGLAARELPQIQPPPGALSEPASAFVTLWRGKALRGCIGRLISHEPLAQVVALAAISAAMHDPRFGAVRAEELCSLDIEISVLSPFEDIAAADVRVGVHGLMIVRGPFRGLLLPQVALEYRWSATRFLEETCVKAGLPRDAWRDSETQISAFTAEVFAERESAENKSGADEIAAPQ